MSSESQVQAPRLDVIVDVIGDVQRQFADAVPPVVAAHASGPRAISRQQRFNVWFLFQAESVNENSRAVLLKQVRGAFASGLEQRGWQGHTEDFVDIALVSSEDHDLSQCLSLAAGEAQIRTTTDRTEG